MTDYLTASEVAALLKCHERTIRRMIGSGDLPATMVAGRYLIDPDHLPTAAPARPKPTPRKPGKAPGPVTEALRQGDAS